MGEVMAPTRTIVIDTREQLPWEFRSPAETMTLKSGDYSLLEMETGRPLEDLVAIERKSLSDFLGSITSGRERFEKEMQRLHEGCEWPWLIVESTLTQIAAGEYRSNVSPKTVFGTIESWMSKYRVRWIFSGDRNKAQVMAESILAMADGGITRCQTQNGSSASMFSQSFESSAGSPHALETAGCGLMGIVHSMKTRTHLSR